jgi:pectin methylesterase-like acyl-CoA thioesterase
MKFPALALIAFALTATANAKTTIKVAADGSGQFKTIQAAVDAANGPTTISIAPGTYREKIHIDKNAIDLQGTGNTPQDVVLVYGDSAAMAGGTGKSGSVTVSGDEFTAENLTIQNDWEKKNGAPGSQAVALLLTGDKDILRHVRLLGYQDTLYAASKTCHGDADKTAAEASGKPCHASRQLFEDCYIEGHVDYIFGDAKAVFKDCELHGMKHQIVTITAQSRLYPLEDSGYLFLHCTITSEGGVDKLSLGRSWRAYARVYFVDTTIKRASLDPSGWMEWKNPDGTGKMATSDYAEYGTHTLDGKPVNISSRLAPSRQLSKTEADKLTVSSWLEGWNVQ